MENCSFKPKTSGDASARRPRDIQQFVKDQHAFLVNKQAKEKLLRKQKEQDDMRKSK